MPSLDDVLSDAQDAVEIDLSGAVDFDDVPNGQYVGKLTQVGTKDSKAGDPYIQLYLDVVKTLSVDGDEPAPKAGAKLPITWLARTGKGTGFTRKALKALGFDMDKDSVKFSPTTAPAKAGLVLVTVKQQKGSDEYQEIASWAPYTESALD